MSTAWAIRKLGFKQTAKGAIIIGVLAGAMAAMQGAAYAASYPTPESRAEFATSLASAPALGVLYGEPKNLASTAGYVVYRVVPFLALIAAIWGLSTATKLLRGQEEDGHTEIITAGATSKQAATYNIMIGYFTAILFATLLCIGITAAVNMMPTIGMTFPSSALIGAAIFLPAIVFSGIGIITSQLSINRKRAFMFGLVPLLAFFVLRALANTVDGMSFMKQLTPFGWSDLISPVIDPMPWWALPYIGSVLIFGYLGIHLSRKRDLGEGILNESMTVQSHLFLLGSPLKLALRQNIWTFISWAVGAIFLSALMASLAKIAVDALVDSPSLRTIITSFGGASHDITIAFIGSGMVFTVMVLLVMVTINVSGIRNDEAKGYLETTLVHPVRRSVWLTSRTLLIATTSLIVALLSCITTWGVARTQGIDIDLSNILLVGIALTGTTLFTLGLGTLFYGIVPRFAVVSMYIIIAWSFVIDMLQSATTINDILARTSLFHYISTSPTATPDWQTFTWLTLLGAAMAATGIAFFTKRDITSS
jgi:ABC-2 type transport system permease protein